MMRGLSNLYGLNLITADQQELDAVVSELLFQEKNRGSNHGESNC